MIDRPFHYKCERCRCEWDSKTSNLNGCRFCHAPLSLQARRRKAEYKELFNLKNPGKVAAQRLMYRLRHPKVLLIARHKRRALLSGSVGHFTAKEFEDLCATYENRCAYCHEELPLGPDHKVPLSKGGSNSIENIVPACKFCNSKKGTATYDEFLQRSGQELAEVKRVRVYMKQHPEVVEAVRQKYFCQVSS